ncbi:MAG: hypothetical protein Q9M30_07365, partial [Mariprofundaceae bacterium]|nr:hypothetical protein [Mariprofundaceae bacterium]
DFKLKSLFLIGMAQTRMGAFSDAKKSFRKVIDLAPESPEGMQSVAALKASPKKAKNFSATASLKHTVDTNVVLAPSSQSAGVIVSRSHDTATALALNLVYASQVNNNWGYSMGYGYSQNIQRRLSFFDTLSQHVDFSPNLRLGKGSAFVQFSADALGVDYRRYLFSFGAMPGYAFSYKDHQQGLIRAGYTRKLFFWTPANADERQTGHNYLLAYTHSFLPGTAVPVIQQLLADKGSRLDLGYTFDIDSTRGANWDYKGYRATISLTKPIREKLQLLVNVDDYRQDYVHKHTSFNKTRHDHLMTLNSALEWQIRPYAKLTLRGMIMRAKSNISVFDYHKSTLTAGIEGRF